MDIHTILILFHLLGFAFGVGGATASDLTFVRSTKGGSVSLSEYNIIKTLSRLIWASVIILVLSGSGLMWLEYANTGSLERLSWSFFQIKLIAFAILVINGLVFHSYVFPLLKSTLGQSFIDEAIKRKYWLFALTGAISIVSWYTAFLSVALSTLFNQLPLLLLLTGYLLLIAGGAMSAFAVLHKHAAESGLIRACMSALKSPFMQLMLTTALVLGVLLIMQLYAVIT